MEKSLEQHSFWISATDRGTYIASSSRSPYFCFEADTEEEASALAGAALNFYSGSEGVVQSSPLPKIERKLVRSSRQKRRIVRVGNAV